MVVSDKTLPEPGTVLRSECEFTNSAFGILVPIGRPAGKTDRSRSVLPCV
jgi:hypothetical protein